jgi:hypothetical protein
MTSDKRDFTNFNEFPGEVKSNGIYSFPDLSHVDIHGKTRQWNIFVRLIESDSKLISNIDWDLKTEKQVKIKKDYFKMGVKIDLSGIKAQAWVEQGVINGKITRSIPTYFNTVKNKDKINERNIFQQALIYGRSQWLKRKDKGNFINLEVDNLNNLEVDNLNNLEVDNLQSKMYFPMLAKTFADGEKHLKFPIYIQPKLDGVRCLAFLNKPNTNHNNVIIYTRTKKIFPSVDYLKILLYPLLNSLYDLENDQSIYLDGELYKHGKRLQDISGDSRNSSANVESNNSNRNEYHIYDCFYPKELNTTFEERYKQLLNIYQYIKPNKVLIQTIKPVPTILLNNMKEVNTQYHKFLKEKYEGAILRNVNGFYLASCSKTGTFLRSSDLIKLKKRFTDEFKVVGYTEGSRGKDKGAIIWICETKNKIKFNVTPKDTTYKERYELFNLAKLNFWQLNKMMTVEYEDLSKTKVPLRAKALTIRNYE